MLENSRSKEIASPWWRESLMNSVFAHPLVKSSIYVFSRERVWREDCDQSASLSSDNAGKEQNPLTFKPLVILPLIACGALAQVPPPPQVPPNGPAPVVQESLQVSYGGSVATGQASATALSLSLRDAIRRGLQYNLGVLSNRDIVDTVRAERRRTLSSLLPNLSRGRDTDFATNRIWWRLASTSPDFLRLSGRSDIKMSERTSSRRCMTALR